MSNLVVREDHVQLFNLYALFGGDAKRVAIVSRVDPERVEALAHDFNWKAKMAGRSRLDTDDGKELEREINRVSVYVTAERLGNVFNNLIADLDSDPDFARLFCTTTDEDTGVKSFNTKNLVELAKGLQTVADVKYRALGDRLAAQADTSGTMKGTGDLVVNIYTALKNRFDHMPAVDTAARVVEAAVLEAHNGEQGK